MKARVYLFFFALLVWGAAAPAQSDIHPGNSNSGHGSIGTLSFSTLSGGINLRSLEGAPFSADVMSETVETMPDGTSSRRTTRGKMFRDAAGRTRSETELQNPAAGAGPRRFITLVDPVQQLTIVLDVAAQTASVSHLTPAPAASASVQTAAAHAALQSGGKRKAPADSEDLGSRMMEGFSVTGTRRARSTAGAAPGKTAVTESWFSSELKVELLATIQVSPSVTRTTRLTNITPGEPDPSLFQIPIGYAVRDNLQQKREME